MLSSFILSFFLAATGSRKVALLAYLVGFAEPGLNLAVHFIGGGEAEGMDVVAWGDRFDLPETGIFQSASQDYVADQVIAP